MEFRIESDAPLASPTLIASLRQQGLLDASAEAAFDQYVRLAAHALDCPMAFAATVDEDRLYVKSAEGLPDDAPRVWPLLRERYEVFKGEAVGVRDVDVDMRTAEIEALADVGAKACLAVPVRVADDHVVGLLVVLDRQERAWSEEQVDLLGTVARSLASEIALRVQGWEQKQVQEQLFESEAWLRLATAAAGVGIFETDLVEGKLYWSDQTCAIYGVPPGTVLDIEEFQSFVPPEDREEVARKLAVAPDPSTGGRFDIEHRIITGTGEVRYVAVRSEVFFEEEEGEQRAVRVLGTVLDVTESRRREEMLRERTARLELALRAAGMGTWDYDLRTGRVFWSPEGERIFGLEPGSFGGTTEHYYALVHPDDVDQVRCAVEAPRTAEDSVLELDYRVKRPDGVVRWVRSIGRLYYDSAGVPMRMIGAVLDVTDRHEYEDGLRAAKERAEEMSRLKSTFLANMSHEIRTPLTAIIGFAELLADEYAGEGNEMVGMIRKSGQRLLGTLNSVLDLAQLDAGTLKLTPDVEDLVQLTAESAELLRQQAREKGLTLRLPATDTPVGALVDRRALHRIVTNLLTNALKFTEEGTVRLDVEARGEHALLRVQDTGIGIDSAFLPHLFDEFRQESTGHSRTHEGSGLGLSITRQLVELMGGTVDVESEKGVGTCFTVAFPLVEVAARTVQERGGSVARLREERPTVLVVEDHDETRQLLEEMLCDLADVLPAHDVGTALALAQRQPFDAALIDVQLGGPQSGIDVMRALRRMPEQAGTPLVACTAFALPGDETRLVEQGFDAYVAKPFLRETLLEVLAEALDSCRAADVGPHREPHFS